MNYLTLKRKTEKNLCYWLKDALPEINLLPGQAYGLEEKIKLPAVIVEAGDAKPDDDLADDAVAEVKVTVSVVTDTREDSDSVDADTWLGYLNYILLGETLADEINADTGKPEPDYHLYEIMAAGEDTQYNGDERRDIISLLVLCHEIEAPAPAGD